MAGAAQDIFIAFSDESRDAEVCIWHAEKFHEALVECVLNGPKSSKTLVCGIKKTHFQLENRVGFPQQDNTKFILFLQRLD